MREPRKTAAWKANLRPVLDAAGQGIERADPEGQVIRGDSRFLQYANLVRLPHTLFALPFALVGTVYASYAARVTLEQAGLVLLAFTAARFAAMGFNRIADHRLDALNPRTQARELPSGRISVREATVAVIVASVAFLLAAWLLNPLCLALAPVALAWILAYSYTKRFTSWSHMWLGASLGIAPVGGYLAITGAWSTPWWTLLSLSGGVLCWVAGFDVFYSLQDESFDRQHGLRSLPVLLGERGSIMIGKLLHGIAIGFFAAFGAGADLGWPYYAGILAAIAVLAWEHQLVRPGDLTRLNDAFFTSNGIISLVILAGTLVDRWL